MPLLAEAVELPPPVRWSQKKLEKFFDLNKDKVLSQYERMLVQTYRQLNWPLARTRLMKKFDQDKNKMLGPYEYQQYLNHIHSLMHLSR